MESDTENALLQKADVLATRQDFAELGSEIDEMGSHLIKWMFFF